MKVIQFKACLKRAYSGLLWPCLISLAAISGVKGATIMVTATSDSGAGSLRQAILNSASGDIVIFTNTLSSATIALTSGELLLGHNLTIDGSSLTSQVIINGSHTSRIFEISSGANVTLNSLVITNGYPGSGNTGGGIYNSGTLALNNCSLAGNSADSSVSGGAIANGGPLTLMGCTLSGNFAGFAGAINNIASTCTLENCTLFGNDSANNGGAIDNTFGATLNVLYCTFSGNVAGGGIDNYLSELNVTNSILYGNISQDIYNWSDSTNNFGSTNIVESVGNAGTLVGSSSILAVNPLLSPPGNYGGPTKTMPPSSGSPAIDAAGPALLNIDQCGYVRPVGAASDIGSVEVAPPTNSPFGNAMVFNGTDQYITVTNFGSIIPTNEITVEFWAYTTAGAVQSAFMLNPDSNANRLNAHLNYGGPASNTGNTYWDFRNIGGGGRLGPVPAPANSITNWVHYAFVASQSGDYMSIYTNGALCATRSGMTPFARGNYSLQIGGPGFPYNGAIDDFRVWNVARSQAQILADMGTPLTGNEPNLVLYYRFDDSGGNPAANSATATGAAYNGTPVNGPGLENAGEPFATATTGTIAYTFTTFAGSSSAGSSDGVGENARFSNPHGVAVDTNGNVYVADFNNDTIRKITSAGVVTTLAGFAGNPGSADGTNSSARFNQPFGVAVDKASNVYVADTMNSTIREITPAGVVSTIAGQAGIGGYTDGTDSAALFNGPFGIAIDNNGNLYVADADNYTIRKITPVGTNWVVTTLAGKRLVQGKTDGNGTNALFFAPWALTTDIAGNIYVCDESPAIRMVTPAGAVTTIAGGTQGFNDGLGTNAQFYVPFGIVADNLTNLYVSDGDAAGTIRKITPLGTNWAVVTFAGTATKFGSLDGTGTNAAFGSPWGITLNNSGNLYVADELNDNIREISSAGVVNTFAGPDNSSSYLDGTGGGARFNSPGGVTVDNAGNLYVADSQNQVIRKITSAGVVSTLAGQPGPNLGQEDGIGNQAQFGIPYGIVADNAGNVYVTQNCYLSTIRKVTPPGVVTTIAGISGYGYLDGPGATALFRNPAGIAIDKSGNLYVAEQANNTIRLVMPVGTNWVVSTIAGDAGNPNGGYQDGTGTNAQFNLPSGRALPSGIVMPSDIAVDNAGNVYVADGGNHVIRKIYPSGTGSITNPANWTVTTLAGVAGVSGTNDGTGANALFGGDSSINFLGASPSGIAVDNSGNLYVGDDASSTIRRITPAGVVTTIAGQVGVAGSADGSGSAAHFYLPSAIALDSTGDVFVVDQGNNTIRKGTFTQYEPANLTTTAPVTNGALCVTLMPAAAGGQWRFGWEQSWRNSGTTASNLAPGNYPVEFRNVPGWLVVQTTTNFTVAVPGGITTYLTNQYYPTISTLDANSSGTLTVNLANSPAQPPIGAGWRFLGDNTPYYPSGYTTNLADGTYLIGFAPVSGFSTPPNLSVTISVGLTTVLNENYLLADAAPAGAEFPFLVPTNEIDNVTNYPFGFDGQLQTDDGYGSGVAVQPKVVLTAAHMMFNDENLSYVSQAYWYFQEEANVTATQPPQVARGWLVLSGYASQRTNDLEGLGGQIYGPGESSPQSRNLDVAALYFDLPVAGGGYGGYLPSDESPNPWLTGNSLKMLAGYPVDGSEFGNASIEPGDMYQTQPLSFGFSQDTEPEVYLTPSFLSYPGNSGGPLYVQFDGYYYPAGVYLGTINNGTYQSAVRAIDSEVVNLITNAESLADNGTNHTGGGVIILANENLGASNPGFLQFLLGPPAALAAGAGWELQGDSSFSSLTNYIRAVISTNASVVFKSIPGWNVPAINQVNVTPGYITTITNALYTVDNPVLAVKSSLGIGITGTTGTVYVIQSRSSLNSGSWINVSTNTITTNGFNLILTLPTTNGPVNFYRAVWLGQ